MEATKTFEVVCTCMAWYSSSLQIPADYTYEQAVEYAKRHIDEIPIVSSLEYISGSDELDESNCKFQ